MSLVTAGSKIPSLHKRSIFIACNLKAFEWFPLCETITCSHSVSKDSQSVQRDPLNFTFIGATLHLLSL